MKNIIENVKLVVSMGLIGAFILYIGSLIFMPDLTVKIFKYQPFVVVTESMEPVIGVNDIVVVKEFDLESANVGDIITFKADIDYNGTLEVVTHYILSIEDTDAGTLIRTHRHFEEGEEIIADTWVIPSSDVIGTYAFQLQYIGYFIGFAKSFYGMAIIGFNIIVISAIVYVSKKEFKKEDFSYDNHRRDNIY